MARTTQESGSMVPSVIVMLVLTGALFLILSAIFTLSVATTI